MHAYLATLTSGIMERLSLAACKINPPKVSAGRLSWSRSRPVLPRCCAAAMFKEGTAGPGCGVAASQRCDVQIYCRCVPLAQTAPMAPKKHQNVVLIGDKPLERG